MGNKSNTVRLAVIGILSAITAIVAFVPIPMFGIEISFAMVPIGVGAILCGKRTGAYLGLVFGIISFLQCLGYSAFGVMIFGINPFFAFLTCVPTRVLAGFLTGLIADITRSKKFSVPLCSVLAPLFNTVFFMTVLMLLYWHTEYLQNMASDLNVFNPFLFVFAFVGINGLVEIIAGAVVTLPVTLGVQRGAKRYL